MYNSFLTSTLLAFESQNVIELRLVRVAWGGREGRAEARLMVAEKMSAAMEAIGTLTRQEPLDLGRVRAAHREGANVRQHLSLGRVPVPQGRAIRP